MKAKALAVPPAFGYCCVSGMPTVLTPAAVVCGIAGGGFNRFDSRFLERR